MRELDQSLGLWWAFWITTQVAQPCRFLVALALHTDFKSICLAQIIVIQVAVLIPSELAIASCISSNSKTSYLWILKVDVE